MILLRAIFVAAVAIAVFFLNEAKTKSVPSDIRAGYERKAEWLALPEAHTHGIWIILLLGVIGLAVSGVSARAAHKNERCPRCAKPANEKNLKCSRCGFDFQDGNILLENTKGCPGCGRLLLKEAVRCRHCRYHFDLGHTVVAQLNS